MLVRQLLQCISSNNTPYIPQPSTLWIYITPNTFHIPDPIIPSCSYTSSHLWSHSTPLLTCYTTSIHIQQPLQLLNTTTPISSTLQPPSPSNSSLSTNQHRQSCLDYPPEPLSPEATGSAALAKVQTRVVATPRSALALTTEIAVATKPAERCHTSRATTVVLPMDLAHMIPTDKFMVGYPGESVSHLGLGQVHLLPVRGIARGVGHPIRASQTSVRCVVGGHRLVV